MPELDHPIRRALNNEVHARPPGNIATPSTVSYLATLIPHGAKAEYEFLCDLLDRFDVAKPLPEVKHFSADLGPFRLRWERHTEFSRYAFIRNGVDSINPFDNTPIQSVPQDWLLRTRGNVLVATHLVITEDHEEGYSKEQIANQFFLGNMLIGSRLAQGKATALTDLKIHNEGFGRILVRNSAIRGPQLGRTVQRLLEIETYRMMTLLALPVAQNLAPALELSEKELTDISDAMMNSDEIDEEQLLERLTRLAAENQNRNLRSEFRFSAAEAYYELVFQRIHELREQRISGLQTFEEFITRRLTPALKTCRSIANRQQGLVQRMIRSTQLLSTRVEVARQKQNQDLLASVNRRVQAQMRLQETVEGLSVVALTYYMVGLIGTLAGGAAFFGLSFDKNLIMSLSIPLVALTAFWGIRRIKNRITRQESNV